jgi:hypothetical protein
VFDFSQNIQNLPSENQLKSDYAKVQFGQDYVHSFWKHTMINLKRQAKNMKVRAPLSPVDLQLHRAACSTAQQGPHHAAHHASHHLRPHSRLAVRSLPAPNAEVFVFFNGLSVVCRFFQANPSNFVLRIGLSTHLFPDFIAFACCIAHHDLTSLPQCSSSSFSWHSATWWSCLLFSKASPSSTSKETSVSPLSL